MGIIDNDSDRTWTFEPVKVFAVGNGQAVDPDGWPVLVIGDGPMAIALPSSEATAQDAMAAARRIQEAIWIYMQAVTTRRLQGDR